MCAFPPVGAAQVLAGEMVKTRPVIVVSRDLPGRGKAVSVIPISMTEPAPIQRYHLEIDAACFPEVLRRKPGTRWAICDQVCTVSRDRLDQVQTGYRAGRKTYWKGKVHIDTLLEIRLAIAYVLKIDRELLGCSPEVVTTEAMATAMAQVSGEESKLLI